MVYLLLWLKKQAHSYWGLISC